MSLAQAQLLPDAGIGGFTNAEHKMAREFEIPGEKKLGAGNEFLFGPKNPIVDVKAWQADHSAKLAGMVRAER